jgi:hypothetical protein
MKPLIWEYFRQKGIAWEKRCIKEHFYNKALTDQINRIETDFADPDDKDNWPLFYSVKKYNILKDVLGLSSVENWRMPYRNTITKTSQTNIDRMKSPLFYKPIETGGKLRVYIDFDYLPTGFLGSEFIISNGNNKFPLKVVEEFNIDDFFDWCLMKADIIKLIAEPYRETKKADQILRIFSQLRKNINY